MNINNIKIKEMPRTKKAPVYYHGIEITKPFSKEMYKHNDSVAKDMRVNIEYEIRDAHRRATGEVAANGGMDKGEKDLRSLVEAFTGYHYGEGYELLDVKDQGIAALNDCANWQLHEEYSYLCFKGIVPRTRFMMVGFDWEKHDYSYCREEDLSPASPEIVPSGLNKK